jgi:hypothetical protein
LQRSVSPEVHESSKHFKKTSLDPLDSTVIHDHVHDLITQHLSGEDLLQMSEVSPNWNRILSSQIARKNRLNFIDDNPSYEKLQLLFNSFRNYKAMAVSTSNFTLANLIAGRIEELKVKSTTVCTESLNGCNHWNFGSFDKFKNLKVLDLSECEENLEPFSLQKAINLKTLAIRAWYFTAFPKMKIDNLLLIENDDDDCQACEQEFRTFMQSFLDLKTLYVWYLTDYVLEVVAEMYPNLKTLSYDRIEEEVIEKHAEMCRGNEDINRGIEIVNSNGKYRKFNQW